MGGSPQAAARHARVRRHDRRQLSVSAATRRARPHRADGDRFGGAAVRDRVSGVLRQGVRRSRGGRGQERPRIGLGGVQLRQRRACANGTISAGSCRPSARCSTTPATASDARRRTRGRTARSRASRISSGDGAPAAAGDAALGALLKRARGSRNADRGAEDEAGRSAAGSVRRRAREAAPRARPRLAADPHQDLDTRRRVR